MTQTTSMSSGHARISYPGELGLPPVGVSFEVPEGWSTAPVPGALAATREAEAGPNGFWANIVTSIDRVGPATSLDKIARELLSGAQATATSITLDEERIVEVSGVPAIVREQTMTTERAPFDLVQLSLVLLVDVGGGLGRDCVQITGSIEAPRRDLLVTVFDHLVATISLDV
ncbi:MAG: hypothetical protein AAGC46_12815 [Solirubrobacteraceae bacterium]|nr:hypothetical protein [Patulibacter sp.]